MPIDELHLIFNKEHASLAERVKADIRSVSPETKVIFDIIQLKDPWDFEEVYEKFYGFAKRPCFHEEKTRYYIHMSTGSHVEQICLFLLAESRHLPAKLVQTTPKEGHVHHSNDPKGTINIIDLDLSRYDKLAKRFETERQDDLTFLKQGIDTKNAAFNKLIETIKRVAVRSSDPILLTGPTGAGKSQLANQIFKLKKQNGQVKGKFVDVNDEIVRCAPNTPHQSPSTKHQAPSTRHQALANLLGPDYAERYDDFDLVQLAHVIAVCRDSDSAADAARKLYAVSFKAKTSSNSTDRLSKYLARFGLKFKEIVRTSPSPISSS